MGRKSPSHDFLKYIITFILWLVKKNNIQKREKINLRETRRFIVAITSWKSEALRTSGRES